MLLSASEWYEIAPGWLGLAVGAWVAITVHRWQSRETARARLHGMIGATCDGAVDLAERVLARGLEYFTTRPNAGPEARSQQDLLTSLKILGRQVTDIRRSCKGSANLKASALVRGLVDQFEAFKAAITGDGFLLVDPASQDRRRAEVEAAGETFLDSLRSVRRKCKGA